RPQWHPAQILAAIPAARCARHSLPLRTRLFLRLGPVAPRMILDRVDTQRRELIDELLAHHCGERSRDADVMQLARIIVKTEKERTDHGARSVLVPAETGDDAIRSARVLDLDHRALACAVLRIESLGHHTVESRPFESTKPILGHL